jgi:membrane-associated phospholipid phosphatase
VLPSAAGAARFDALVGIELFARFYSRNPNVFGATPSLHVAYAVMAAWHLWHRGLFARGFGVAFSLLIGFSAVYLAHHYVLDVVAGAATGLITCVVVDRAFARLQRARALRRNGGHWSRAAA